MKILYLSGPMTGIEDYNYPAFHEAAKALRGRGYTVLNPAETAGGEQGLDREWYMRHDIAMLPHCTGIVVMPDWHNSAGARAEVVAAAAMGLDLFWTNGKGSLRRMNVRSVNVLWDLRPEDEG